MMYLKFKRFYDFVLALLGIILLSPILLLIVILSSVAGALSTCMMEWEKSGR